MARGQWPINGGLACWLIEKHHTCPSDCSCTLILAFIENMQFNIYVYACSFNCILTIIKRHWRSPFFLMVSSLWAAPFLQEQSKNPESLPWVLCWLVSPAGKRHSEAVGSLHAVNPDPQYNSWGSHTEGNKQVGQSRVDGEVACGLLLMHYALCFLC